MDELMKELWLEEVGPYKNKVKRAYPDSKGKMTIGIGHLIGDGSQKAYEKSEFYNRTLTKKEILDLARKDSDVKIKRVLDQFGKQFFDFYPETQIQIVSSYYRGGLPGSLDTLKHMMGGDYASASKEFLKHGDYHKSVKEGTGVAPRMEKLSKALAKEAERAEAREHASSPEFVGPPHGGISFQDAVERRLKTK